jgi:3-hydroxybutyryl-CoA dehydratase
MIELAPGQDLPTGFSIQVTEEMVQKYAEVSGDYNPIHLSTEAAQKAGFPEKIAHGMLSMGISTRLLSPYLSASMNVSRYETRFTAPLFVGQTLHIKGWVEGNNGREITVCFHGKNDQDIEILKGRFVVKKRNDGDVK